MAQANTAGQLGWLLDNLTGRVEHIRQAVVLSRDGLVVAASQNMSREEGDHMSAVAAACRAWPAGLGSTSPEERYARPSSRWNPPSCSS